MSTDLTATRQDKALAQKHSLCLYQGGGTGDVNVWATG